jgi:hypothetical protein
MLTKVIAGWAVCALCVGAVDLAQRLPELEALESSSGVRTDIPMSEFA